MASGNDTPSGSPVQLIEESACQRLLRLEIAAAEVEQELSAVARRLARRVTLPGFRKGKVPVEVVRRRFAAEVEDEASEALASRRVSEILETRGLEPVAQPEVRHRELTPEGTLRLDVVFEVESPFELGSYRDLEARRPSARVTEAEVDQELEGIRQALARLRTVEDRGARRGDSVLFDLDGEYLEGGGKESLFQRAGVTLDIGGDEVHPDLSAAFEGMRPSEEKEVTIGYPGDYRTPALAGTTVRYRIRLTTVREKQIPDLGDEMAREAGQFADLQALRNRVRQDLETARARRAESTVHQELLRQLLERHPFEVPATPVAHEVRHRLEELARGLAARGVDPTLAGIDWKAEKEKTEARVIEDLRSARLLDAIGDREAIDVPAEAVDAFFEVESRGLRQGAAPMRARWEKEGRIAALTRHLRRRRVLDFLVSVGHIHGEEE